MPNKQLHEVYGTIAVGEVAGSAAAAQLPNVPCRQVMLQAAASNVGKVYVGGAGVTKPDGATDTTTGIELAPGVFSAWLPVDNLNRLYYISDNAGDDLLYIAMVG